MGAVSIECAYNVSFVSCQIQSKKKLDALQLIIGEIAGNKIRIYQELTQMHQLSLEKGSTIQLSINKKDCANKFLHLAGYQWIAQQIQDDAAVDVQGNWVEVAKGEWPITLLNNASLLTLESI
jgi:hypothetical protein